MKHPRNILESIKNRLEQYRVRDHQLWMDFAELEELLLFYHEVIEKCPVAIYLTDGEKQKLVWANGRAHEVLGAVNSQSEQFFEDNIHPQDLEDTKKRMKRFENYHNRIQEGAFRIKDGISKRYHWKYVLMTAFAKKEGKSQQFLNASFDLNEALQDRLNFYESLKDQSRTVDNAPTNHLTSREKEILRLIVRGFTMREVAEQLKISHHTAGTHRKNLFKKTKVNKTSELIRYAMQNGLD